MPELTGLPTEGPATLAGVKSALRVKDSADDDRIGAIVAAVNVKVRGWPVSRAAVDVDGDPDRPWPADIVQGATMLAARLWRRKDSPAGVEAVGELAPAYVMHNDPDIAMLLRLNAPQVG